LQVAGRGRTPSTVDCQLRTHDYAGRWQVVDGEEGRPGVRRQRGEEGATRCGGTTGN
jgi:hypothetical protein